MAEPGILLAFGLGILFFISPCILPLVPAYLSYLSGISLSDPQELKSSKLRAKVFVNALLFVLGFSVIFVILGATASYIGQVLFFYRFALAKVGGVLLIIFALQTLGIFNFLKKPVNLKTNLTGVNYLKSLLAGVAFSIGWTPCVGPLFSGILVLAAATATVKQGIMLLSFFSLGLAIPFLLISLFIVPFNKLVQKQSWIFLTAKIISAIILITLGILLLTNNLSTLIGWLYQHGWGVSL